MFLKSLSKFNFFLLSFATMFLGVAWRAGFNLFNYPKVISIVLINGSMVLLFVALLLWLFSGFTKSEADDSEAFPWKKYLILAPVQVMLYANYWGDLYLQAALYTWFLSLVVWVMILAYQLYVDKMVKDTLHHWLIIAISGLIAAFVGVQLEQYEVAWIVLGGSAVLASFAISNILPFLAQKIDVAFAVSGVISALFLNFMMLIAAISNFTVFLVLTSVFFLVLGVIGVVLRAKELCNDNTLLIALYTAFNALAFLSYHSFGQVVFTEYVGKGGLLIASCAFVFAMINLFASSLNPGNKAK